MLNILGNSAQYCDKIERRSMLKIGALGLAGLSLPNLLRQRAQAAEATGAARSGNSKAVILVWLGGGPSHIDMYDLKPEAPREFRGDFNPIATNIPGTMIGEHLPHEAKIMDKMSVVRSVTHPNAGHGMASQWLMTGRMPTIEINDNIFPSTGSIVSRMRGPNEPSLPAYVTLPQDAPYADAAYLGPQFNPFNPGADPNQEGFQVRNLRLPGRVDLERLNDRRKLLSELDTLRRDLDREDTAKGLDQFYVEAMDMVTSKKALDAFAIQKEDPRLRERYGRDPWGQSCLLARRLVEAGVTFVTVNMGGWDTHGNNFSELKTRLLPKYDQSVAALISDLAERGLSDKVLVMTMGEFGRTPRINPQAGRDHWPGAMSVVFAGGGLKMGQMIGTTDPRAEYPATRAASPADVLSTMYRVMGIDTKHIFMDQGRRPMPILSEGEPIQELLG